MRDLNRILSIRQFCYSPCATTCFAMQARRQLSIPNVNENARIQNGRPSESRTEILETFGGRLCFSRQ